MMWILFPHDPGGTRCKFMVSRCSSSRSAVPNAVIAGFKGSTWSWSTSSIIPDVKRTEALPSINMVTPVPDVSFGGSRTHPTEGEVRIPSSSSMNDASLGFTARSNGVPRKPCVSIANSFLASSSSCQPPSISRSRIDSFSALFARSSDSARCDSASAAFVSADAIFASNESASRLALRAVTSAVAAEFSAWADFSPAAFALVSAPVAAVFARVAASAASPAFEIVSPKTCSSWARRVVSALDESASKIPSPATPRITRSSPRYEAGIARLLSSSGGTSGSLRQWRNQRLRAIVDSGASQTDANADNNARHNKPKEPSVASVYE